MIDDFIHTCISNCKVNINICGANIITQFLWNKIYFRWMFDANTLEDTLQIYQRTWTESWAHKTMAITFSFCLC